MAKAELQHYIDRVVRNDMGTNVNLLDFATLHRVPAVEWETVDETEHRSEHYRRCGWCVSQSVDANGIVSAYGVQLDTRSPCYWRTMGQAKRYAEIKLHLAEIERKLLKELVEK